MPTVNTLPVVSNDASAGPNSKSPFLKSVVIGASLLAISLVVGTITVGMISRASAADARDPKPTLTSALEATGAKAAEPGLTYTNVKIPSEPWSIHVLKIDRKQKDLMI